MYIYITVHHVPKYMSCHKAIVVITGRAHIYYVHPASVRFEHSVCCGSLMTAYIHIYIYTPVEKSNFSYINAIPLCNFHKKILLSKKSLLLVLVH